MPRLDTDDDQMERHQIGASGFSFTGARISSLGASEYTLATIVLDCTGSLQGHERDLRAMLATVAKWLRDPNKNPRCDNTMLRVVIFNSWVGVHELHGFKPIMDVDPDGYPEVRCYGGTPLYDACYEATVATNLYGAELDAMEYLANAISIYVTDGENTHSTATPAMVGKEVAKSVSGEVLESHVTFLVGITSSAESQAALDRFAKKASLTSFMPMGDATPEAFAKIAGWVSQSVSSTSQALGTGGPSQKIAPVI